jgi:hypothetical protein
MTESTFLKCVSSRVLHCRHTTHVRQQQQQQQQQWQDKRIVADVVPMLAFLYHM